MCLLFQFSGELVEGQMIVSSFNNICNGEAKRLIELTYLIG